MADASKALPDNVPGPLFVDETCIDCGACRWIAPASFVDAGDSAAVGRQPAGAEEEAAAWRALVACPTGSIGRHDGARPPPPDTVFPHAVAPAIFHCGFHAEASFGAAAWFIRRPAGNVLVDSPRFSTPLVKAIEAAGGIATMVLTHRDDVADHARFAARFGCQRVIHAADADAVPDAERLIEGTSPVVLADDLLVIPVPGHTAGSVCLLHGEALFTGDHLAWDRRRDRLTAFRRACWYDWPSLVASMERLAGYDFARVLPGHGAPCHLSRSRMAREMAALLARLGTM